MKSNHTNATRGGWGYVPEQKGTVVGDMSNSGWAFMFLKSAKVARLKVPFDAIEGAMRFMDACEQGRVPGDPYSGHRYTYEPGNATCRRRSCQLPFCGGVTGAAAVLLGAGPTGRVPEPLAAAGGTAVALGSCAGAERGPTPEAFVSQFLLEIDLVIQPGGGIDAGRLQTLLRIWRCAAGRRLAHAASLAGSALSKRAQIIRAYEPAGKQ